MRFIKGLINALWLGAKLPCPMWLALFLAFTLAASATVPVYYGSINVPSAGSATFNTPIAVLGTAATNGTAAQYDISADNATTANLVFRGGTAGTSLYYFQNSTGVTTYATIGNTGVTAPGVFFNSGGAPSTTIPFIGNDGSGTNGVNFTIPTASTLGWRFFTYDGSFHQKFQIDPNGNETLSPSGTATSGSTFFPTLGSLALQESTWNGSAAVTNTYALKENAGKCLEVDYTPSGGATTQLNETCQAGDVAFGSVNLFETTGASLISLDAVGTPSQTVPVFQAANSSNTPLFASSLTHNDSYQVMNFEGSSGPGTCGGAPATIFGSCYGLGNGTTNNIAIGVGPQLATSGWGCVSSCTVSDSAKICLYNMNTTGPASECVYRSQGTGSWVLGNGAGTALTLTGVLSMGGNTISSGGGNVTGIAKVGTNAVCSGTGSFTGPGANNSNCQLTMSSGTSTWTFGAGYAAKPVCVATDETAATAPKITPSTASVVVTAGTSDVVDVHCFGNGGV